MLSRILQKRLKTNFIDFLKRKQFFILKQNLKNETFGYFSYNNSYGFRL